MDARILIVGNPGLFSESLTVLLTQRHREIAVNHVRLPDEAYILTPHVAEADLVIATGTSFIEDETAPLVSVMRKQFDGPPLLVLADAHEGGPRELPSGLGSVTLLPKERPLSVFLQAVQDALSARNISLPGIKRTRIKLTGREHEVLDALSEGKSNKEIAKGLDIAPNTVRVHVSALLQKLSVRNRVEAAIMAREQQQLSP